MLRSGLTVVRALYHWMVDWCTKGWLLLSGTRPAEVAIPSCFFARIVSMSLLQRTHPTWSCTLSVTYKSSLTKTRSTYLSHLLTHLPAAMYCKVHHKEALVTGIKPPLLYNHTIILVPDLSVPFSKLKRMIYALYFPYS
jgi:hypothetical protein